MDIQSIFKLYSDPTKVKIKPCPFCGEYPVLKQSLSDWQGKFDVDWARKYPEFHFHVLHKEGCFFRLLNGMNRDSETTSSNWQYSVYCWNERSTK